MINWSVTTSARLICCPYLKISDEGCFVGLSVVVDIQLLSAKPQQCSRAKKESLAEFYNPEEHPVNTLNFQTSGECDTMEACHCAKSRDDDKAEAEEDYEDFLEPSLFVNENYKVQTYTFGDESIELYCLQSSLTDFDLTGQMVWPGAELLADYLLKNKPLLCGSSIIELGAGVGLLCAKHCESVVLTDHNDIVLKVMRMSVEHQIPVRNPTSPNVEVHKLEWGRDDDLDPILDKHPNGFNIIIGADLCYQESFVSSLFSTIRSLLKHNLGGSSALLAYVSRTKRMDVAIVAEALRQHLDMREIPGTRRSVCGGVFEGWVYTISLRGSV